jgi:cytochrome c2
LHPDTAGVYIPQAKNMDLKIEIKDILSKKDPRTAATVNVIYDPYFKSAKTYKGYYITPILDSIIRSNHFDTTNALVIFNCTDGYRPVMNLANVFGNIKGYIAIEDLSAGQGTAAKFKPYYLIWDSVKKDEGNFAWPYGLTDIRLISMNAEYKSIYPFKDPQLVNGFNLFRNNCMKCHSVNGIGGSMGPEFNIPKNITEYWKEEDILAFARNPKDYRYNSHMPPMGGLSDSALLKIIAYLRSMKDHRPKN